MSDARWNDGLRVGEGVDEARLAKLKLEKRRVSRARKFPTNTCPASRHLHIIADCLADRRAHHAYPMLIEEPIHCAETMYSVLTSLWEARTKLAKLEARAKQLDERATGQARP